MKYKKWIGILVFLVLVNIFFLYTCKEGFRLLNVERDSLSIGFLDVLIGTGNPFTPEMFLSTSYLMFYLIFLSLTMPLLRVPTLLKRGREKSVHLSYFCVFLCALLFSLNINLVQTGMVSLRYYSLSVLLENNYLILTLFNIFIYWVIYSFAGSLYVFLYYLILNKGFSLVIVLALSTLIYGVVGRYAFRGAMILFEEINPYTEYYKDQSFNWLICFIKMSKYMAMSIGLWLLTSAHFKRKDLLKHGL